MLFDTSPERDEDRSGRKATKRQAAPLAALPEHAEEPPPPVAYCLEPLGRTSDEECGYCRYGEQTIYDVYRKEWHVQCDCCGLAWWRPEIPGHLAEKPAAFRFREGRLAGKTPAEAAQVPRGLDTMRVYAQSHKDEEVRRECQLFLDSIGRG